MSKPVTLAWPFALISLVGSSVTLWSDSQGQTGSCLPGVRTPAATAHMQVFHSLLFFLDLILRYQEGYIFLHLPSQHFSNMCAYLCLSLHRMPLSSAFTPPPLAFAEERLALSLPLKITAKRQLCKNDSCLREVNWLWFFPEKL